MGLYVPAFILGYLSVNPDFSFEALIWRAPKTYKDVKFCKEPKTIIVVDEWFNSSTMYNFSDPEYSCRLLIFRLYKKTDRDTQSVKPYLVPKL